ITLSVMFLDRQVDRYDQPHAFLCGDCVRCLSACPTDAFAAPGVVDARRCLSYHSVENRGSVPVPLRRGFAGRVFGCDICQTACPWNRADIPEGDRRFQPRALAMMSAAEMAALSKEQFEGLSAGMAVARAKYHGFRRNALLSLGAERNASAREIVARLCEDPSDIVANAASWALERIDSPRAK
ncbi:MAG TPA: 4Fe-4S double cluster binding domain-containing protein, partial [Polyangia bacterium]